MFYIIIDEVWDEEDSYDARLYFDSAILLEGPNISNPREYLKYLQQEFYDIFDKPTKEEIEYPEFKGSWQNDTEREKHHKKCDKLRKEWEDNRKSKIIELSKIYPGKNETYMFVSYLKVKYLFTEVPSVYVN